MWTRLKLLFGPIGTFLTQIIDALNREDQAGTFGQALDYAKLEVARLEGMGDQIGGDEKREAARHAVLARLVVAGKALEPYLVDLAVMFALAALRGALGQRLEPTKR